MTKETKIGIEGILYKTINEFKAQGLLEHWTIHKPILYDKTVHALELDRIDKRNRIIAKFYLDATANKLICSYVVETPYEMEQGLKTWSLHKPIKDNFLSKIIRALKLYPIIPKYWKIKLGIDIHPSEEFRHYFLESLEKVDAYF